MDNRIDEKYQRIFEGEWEHYRKFAKNLARKGGIFPGGTWNRTIKGTIKYLYMKHIEQVQPDVTELAEQLEISENTLLQSVETLESKVSYYLKSVDRKIQAYIKLFKTSMEQIKILSDKKYITINEFLDYTKHLCLFWNVNTAKEMEKFFARYFYLTGFKAKSGRIASEGTELYVTPEAKNRCVLIQVRGDSDGL
ncbi:MAG: hypothetical protein ACP5D6_08945 [Kosmotogaceae bacterium]